MECMGVHVTNPWHGEMLTQDYLAVCIMSILGGWYQPFGINPLIFLILRCTVGGRVLWLFGILHHDCIDSRLCVFMRVCLHGNPINTPLLEACVWVCRLWGVKAVGWCRVGCLLSDTHIAGWVTCLDGVSLDDVLGLQQTLTPPQSLTMAYGN